MCTPRYYHPNFLKVKAVFRFKKTKHNILVRSVSHCGLQPVVFLKNMIVLCQLCTVVGFKVRLNVIKEAISYSIVSPAPHLLSSHPSLISCGPSTVMNHCALYTQLQAYTCDQAWPIMEPHCPLSTSGPTDGHRANESPCMRFVIGVQKKKRWDALRALYDLEIQSHLSCYTESQTEKEANPEEKRVKWIEITNPAVHVLCLGFHTREPISFFLA